LPLTLSKIYTQEKADVLASGLNRYATQQNAQQLSPSYTFMNIGLLAFGTRGDISPFLALAIGLKNAGHNPNIAIISPLGVDYSQYEQKFGVQILQPALDQCDIQTWKKMSTTQATDLVVSLIKNYVIPCCNNLCKDNQIVIGLENSYYLHAYAELHKKPYITLSYQHSTTPTLDSWEPIEKWVNKLDLSHANSLRSWLKLPLLDNLFLQSMHSSELQLLSVSQVFCEEHDDWKGHRYVCGYFSLDNKVETTDIPRPLTNFLASDEKPIFFTLGSFNYRNDGNTGVTEEFIRALKKLGRKAIIQIDESTPQEASLSNDDNIYILSDFVDYTQVLPHCSMAIHHGGAGTSHITLSCGCPSIVLYSEADTPIWAYEMSRLGIAEAIALKDACESEFIKKVNAILHAPKMKEEAIRLSKIASQERGVERAVKIITEKYTHLG